MWLFNVPDTISQQCTDDSFAIAYEGQTYFAVDKDTGICSCETFRANQFVTFNGSAVGGATGDWVSVDEFQSLLSNYSQLKARLDTLEAQNAQALGGQCFTDSDCNANLTLACSPSKLRCLGDIGATCVATTQCLEGTFCASNHTCLAVPCVPRVAPVAGSVSLSNNGLYPSHVVFTCDSGYDMVGPSDATCNMDGLWTPDDEPTCNDINECATNHGGCSPFADCANTVGGFTCTCQAGMLGDGFTCAGAKADCYELLVSSGYTLSSGYYLVGTTNPQTTYCDMSIDAGGWTTFWAAPNGASTIPGVFENDPATYTCTDPGTSCIRRLPPGLTIDYDFMAVCGSQAVKFSATQTLLTYFTSGTKVTSWTAVASTPVTTLVVPYHPTMYMLANGGWVLSATAGATNVFLSGSTSATYNLCNGISVTGVPSRLMYRPPTGEVYLPSCLDILQANASATSGVYTIDPDGPSGPQFPFKAYCDMQTDGGGWTTFFSGKQGNFYYTTAFESLAPSCPDPSTQCLRYLPPIVDTTHTVLATCGQGAVKFALTTQSYNYFKSGTAFASFQLLPGAMPATSNTMDFAQIWIYASNGWVLSGSNTLASQTFSSSYSASTTYDLCNGQVTNGQPTRLAYRPSAQVFSGLPLSCNEWKVQNASLTSGLYWIDSDGAGPGLPYQAYCDMETDGGGWTAFHSFRSGHLNVFDRFENTAWDCLDPETQCLRRLPAHVNINYTVMAQCGAYNIKFLLTTQTLAYFQSGTVSTWSSVPGSMPVTGGVYPYNAMQFFGGSGNVGWALASATTGLATTFMASHTAVTYDYCNGLATTDVPSRLYYRVSSFGGEPVSCLEIKQSNASATSGLYWIDPDGPGRLFPYQTLCDMDHDGGGWTAFYTGKTGSTNYFNKFDATLWDCTDPETKCMRALPPRVDLTYTVMATCGTAGVKFNLQSAAMLNYFQSMAVMTTTATWYPLSGAVPAPVGNYTSPPTDTYSFGTMFLLPLNGWTLAAKTTAGVTTFASSTTATTYNYCNGVADTMSTIGLWYREPLEYNLPSSCLEIQQADPSARSGMYWIDVDGSGSKFPYEVLCEMELDGGGYTTFFVALSGYANYLNTFESTEWDCPDAGTRCIRRLPPGATAYSIVATCGDHAMKFTMTAALLAYMSAGTGTAAWSPITYYSYLSDNMQAVASSPGQWYMYIRMPGFAIAPKNANPAFTASTTSTAYNFCNGVSATGINSTRLLYREQVDVTYPTSCADIIQANSSATSGVYMIDPDGVGPILPYKVYCNHDLDGGGYTAFWTSRQGNANKAFVGGFETQIYNCPVTNSQCLKRLPATVDTSYTLMAVCGPHAVKMLFSTNVINYFRAGTQQTSWQTVLGAIPVTGSAMDFPNGASWYLGGGSSYGWMLGRSTAAADMFTSSYTQSTAYDFCNGVTGTGTPSALYYRQNMNQADYPISCLEILQNNASSASGLYTIDSDGTGPNFPMQVYCDMETDGGGWTSFLRSVGGYTSWNVNGGGFDQVVTKCTDPTSRCQYRLPARVTTDFHVLAQCGFSNTSIKFPLTTVSLNYFKGGTASGGWTPLPGAINATGGVYAHRSMNLWTATSAGWILAALPQALGTTFMSSRSTSGYDACNGVSMSGHPIRLYYREPVYIEYPANCQEILEQSPTATSGLYWIDPDGTGPMYAYRAWCEMDLDDGGWTAFWMSPTNGNAAATALATFGVPDGAWDCPYPDSQCMRRLPAAATINYEFLVQCGTEAVRFLMPAAVLAYFQTGAAQSSWVPLYGNPWAYAPATSGVAPTASFSFYSYTTTAYGLYAASFVQ